MIVAYSGRTATYLDANSHIYCDYSYSDVGSERVYRYELYMNGINGAYTYLYGVKL